MKFEEDKSFDLLISPSILALRKYNEIKAFVETAFTEYKLFFSLLEMNVINEGIGETLIYGNYINNDLHKKHKEYIELVNKFKQSSDFSGGVSSYKEWYGRGMWYSLNEGGQSSLYYNFHHYDWTENSERKNAGEYGEKSGLTDEYIEYYLNAYLKEIKEFELGNYPFFAVIVKPLGYLDKRKKEIIPLGNMYLHFATARPFDENFLKNFMKDFLILWHKNYGGILVEELKTRIINGMNMQSSPVDKYIPTMPYGEKNTRRKHIITLLENAHINNDIIVQKHLTCITEDFTLFLLKEKGLLEDDKSIFSWESFQSYINVRYSNNIDIEKFCKVIAVRRMILIMHILFDYSLIQIHRFFSSGQLNSNDYREKETPYAYFYDLFFRTKKEIKETSNLRSKMYEDSSEDEKSFIVLCIKKIYSLIPDDRHKDFVLSEKVKSNFA